MASEAVLHPHWTRAGTLFVWGESGGGPRSGRGRRHPGALGPPALRPLLHTAAGTAYLTRWQPETRRLELPSRGNRPLPWHTAPVDHPTDLFDVPGYALDSLASVDLLLHPPADPRWSPALEVLARLADLGEELVARGRLMPRLLQDPPRTVWTPWLPDERDLDRREALRRLLPPVLLAERAGTPGGSRRKRLVPGTRPWSADELVDAVLVAVVDGTVRAVLADEGGDLVRQAREAGAGLSGRFVASLASRDSRLDSSPVALAALAEELDAWQGRRAEAARAPFELVLRLGEPPGEDPVELDDDPTPEEDGAAWGLRAWVRSTLEPSLRIPLAEALDPPPSRARELGRFQESLRSQVLADLDGLAQVFPPLARLRAGDRSRLALDAGSAHDLLRDAGDRLAARGVVLELPTWWAGGRRRLGLTVAAWPRDDSEGLGDAPLAAAKLARFRWRLALDGEGLGEDELRRVARAQRGLIRLRDAWVEVDPAAARAAADLLSDSFVEGRDASVLDVLRAAAEVEPPPWELPVQGTELGGTLRSLLGEPTREASSAAPPPGFRGTLRPYQARGVAWMEAMTELGLGACLADDMGLGKTVQVLALLARRKAAGEEGPTLLVAPTSVLTTWEREAARFLPDLRVVVHHGPRRAKGKALAALAASHDLVVTSYALLPRDERALKAVAWTRIVLDEAQAIKNPRTRAARAARRLPAAHRLALTGTPVENRLMDLWALFLFLEPGLLGSRQTFRGRFTIPVERHGDGVAAARLRTLVGPFLLRRRKDEVLPDLPEKQEARVDCGLTREQATLYQAVLDEMLERVASTKGIERRGLVLATLTRLRQVCNHPAQLTKDRGRVEGRSGKLARLEELVAEARSAGEKVLVFTQYRVMGELLVARLEQCFGGEVPFLHGGVPRPGRDALVERFQTDPDVGVLVLSLKAGGTGLTLTAASHVVHYDRWWNPAVEEQATDRAHRIGQRRRVRVRKLVCRGTLEERLDRILETKRTLAETVITPGEAWITELDDAALRDLLALGAR